ncbi:hypothetical protein HO133_006174 [Letharia lupina]|uniref:Uncharacterized protein n=1 Tax=Letharia lupina TaxID=560253 RepID=A0A8H6C7I4_9LECA|nr:uncharacterized protein HO133_006174 [Letharia lupina]KAF6218213.1 hypothetical protein HO133_006174 [Letharia lupina]
MAKFVVRRLDDNTLPIAASSHEQGLALAARHKQQNWFSMSRSEDVGTGGKAGAENIPDSKMVEKDGTKGQGGGTKALRLWVEAWRKERMLSTPKLGQTQGSGDWRIAYRPRLRGQMKNHPGYYIMRLEWPMSDQKAIENFVQQLHCTGLDYHRARI